MGSKCGMALSDSLAARQPHPEGAEWWALWKVQGHQGEGAHTVRLWEGGAEKRRVGSDVWPVFASEQGKLLLGAHHVGRGHQWAGACWFVNLCVCSCGKAFSQKWNPILC